MAFPDSVTKLNNALHALAATKAAADNAAAVHAQAQSAAQTAQQGYAAAKAEYEADRTAFEAALV